MIIYSQNKSNKFRTVQKQSTNRNQEDQKMLTEERHSIITDTVNTRKSAAKARWGCWCFPISFHGSTNDKGTASGGPFVGGYILSAARTPTKRELCGIALENFLLSCQMPGFDWAFIFWLTFAGGQTKSSRMGVKMSSRTPGSRASQPWMMPSVFSIVSPAVTSRTSPPMVKRKRPDTT